MSDNGRKRKNPWGNDNKDRNEGPRSPWGGGGQGGGGNNNEPPDLDDLIRKAQDGVRDVLPFNLGSGAVLGVAVIVLLAVWLASGFYIVNPGEHGVIQRFGKWTHTKAEEGLGYHFPFPIETVQKVNVTELRKMEIGQTVQRTSSRSSASKNGAAADESLMLTSDRNIVELQMDLQWNIKSAEDYIFNIKDPDHTIKKVTESAIREVVGQTDMFPIITSGRAILANKTKEIIQRNLDEYKSGVNILQVLIQKAEVHPEVQNAFQDVQSAKQDAEDTENQAQAYREDIIPKARGEAIKIKQQAEAYRQEQIAKAEGDADRFMAVYKAYLSGKDVTKERIFIETMESVFQNAQKIILDSKGGNQGVVPYLPLNEMTQPKNGSR